MKEKVFAIILSLALILTMAPMEVFGDTAGQLSSGRICISNKIYEIAPDIKEREYITNNLDLSAQQMGHVLEVKLGENAEIIAGYNDYNIDAIKSGTNWNMRRTTEQAQAAEIKRKVNVVGAVNGDFFDMSNGRPRGVLVMNSTVIQKSSFPCFYIDKDNVPHIEESSANLPDDVKEAVGGATVIVKDGQPVNTGDATKNPRTAIGIKADNSVVIFMVDGRQAPLSVGMDYPELAATMIDLGCVTALNLDGGGSSTFATQRAGDEVGTNNETAGLTMRCSPSDGYERTVSSSVFVVSTSQADGKFDHAILTPNDEVYTPGSTVQFEAVGADRSGAAAPLPENGLTWRITSGSELGTINAETGEFTASKEKTGKVAVALSYEGKIVGETSVQLQWPDKLGFTNSSVSLDFGETSDLSFAPTWQGREVHYKDGDFVWSVDENSDLAYKKSILAETYTKPGWGGYDSQVMIPLTGNIGGVASATVYYNNYLVYETSYEETSRNIGNSAAGEIIVEETLTHKGAKLYSFVDGSLLKDDITEDLNETISGVACKVVGIKATQTVQFSLGKLNNNEFTADDEASFKGKIKVTLKDDDSISDEIDVVVGMEPYVLMDFEDGHIDPISGNKLSAEEYWTVHVGNSQDNGSNTLSNRERKIYRLMMRDTTAKGVSWPKNEDGSEKNQLVNAEDNSNVRFGNHAMQLAWDFRNVAESSVAAADFGFSAMIYAHVVQPTKIGFWVNVPKTLEEDTSQLKMIFVGGITGVSDTSASDTETVGHAYYDMDAEGKLTWHENEQPTGTTQYLNYYSHDAEGNVTGSQLKDWAGKGWTWVEADLSGAKFPIGIQYGYTIRVVSPQNHVKKEGSLLIDNLQLIYGTNTNDINNPVIESIVEKGSNVNLKTAGSGVKFTTTQPTFDIALNDSKATDKYASGIDVTSIKLAIDGFDCTSDAEITQNPTGDSSVLLKTSQLTNGEHSLKVRVKDSYGNETIETYSFLIESEEAVNAAVSVVPQDGAAVIGDTYQLKVENRSDLQTEYVDAADVTIEIGNDYGAAIKDDLTTHIIYGKGYEEASAPEYADGKVTLHVKKQAQDEQNAVVYGKMIAALSVQIPADARQGDTLNYAVPSGYYIQNAQGMTFSQAQSKIALSAEYTITADQAIAGCPVTFKLTDKDGNIAKNLKLYLGVSEIRNPYTFTAAGRYTVYAKDDAGKRSWNYDIVVNALGTDENGAPFGIQNNASKDGSSQKTVTWLAAIDGSSDAAYIKIAESEAALDSAESKAGTSRLFTFTETNSGNAYRLNEVKLSGLESGKTYYYKVGDGEKWSEVLSFTTASSDKNAKTNFFIFADIQTSDTANLSAAIENVKSSDKNYAFGIQTGDAIDNVTAFNNWRAYLTTLNAGKLGSIDVMHTLGNHEYYGDSDGETAGSMFSIPAHTAGSYDSAEYGSVYTGVIHDGGDILAALQTAKEDAAKSSCAWKVLVLHQPIYGTESLMEETKRLEVTKAIEEAGFDAVFSGDDHAYARTFPMQGDQALDAGSRDGVVYYVCGDLSGKDNEYHERDVFASMIPHKDYKGMYMSVEADEAKMVLNAYRYNGELLDSYTIAKTDCELGKHTFDENCLYDMAAQTIRKCSICQQDVPAAGSGYTGILSTTEGKGKVMLVAGALRTGWFVFGEEIYHAGGDGLLHNTTTYDTATCLEDGHIMSTCECGKTYTGAYTYSKGHSWDSEHVCTVCGVTGKDIANVTLSLNGQYWEYTGKSIRASANAVDGDYVLSAASDRTGRDAYKSYSNNIDVGFGTVTFEGRGNYFGTNFIQFPIVPKSVTTIETGSVLATTAALSWNAADGAGYYRVYKKTDTTGWEKVGNTEATGIVITGLKPDTTYYFRVGTGRVVGANTFRGLNWSKTATVTTAAADTKKTADTITAISAEMKISGGTPLTLKAEEKDGKMYLMLPSSVDLTALTLHLDASEELKNVMVFGCKGENIFDGKDTTVNVLELNGALSNGQSKLYLSLNGEEPIELLLMQSANLASMYLTSDDPQAQGRDYVDAAKSHAVTAQMQMLSADGTVIYDGALKQLKARGNSTFTYYPKKSYQIKLGTESDLLGTHEQVKTWVLLAGYADATQMRDKLFKDLAAGMGMAYTASCDWVDLYYDGEYRGTYLLSEKNAVGVTSIPITDMEKEYEAVNNGYGESAEVKEDVNKYEQKIVYTDGLTDPENITGGYLIERNLETIDEANGFYTRTGSGFNVKSPEFLSKEAMSYISEYYQEFEDAVYAVDEEGNYTGFNEATGKYYYDYCDKDSLIKVFLLQDLALNPDGFLSSFFFYKDKDGKMYAGPIWDQELSFGAGFTKKIDASITNYHYLAEALVKIPDFKAAVEEYYKTEFKGQVENLISDEGTIAHYYSKLERSAQMNYVLWPYVQVGLPSNPEHLWKAGTQYSDVIADMQNWIAIRLTKLDVLHGDGNEHVTHDYVKEVVKAATYEEEGLIRYTCKICNAFYTEVIPKLTKPAQPIGGGGIVLPPQDDTEVGEIRIVNENTADQKTTLTTTTVGSKKNAQGQNVSRISLSAEAAQTILDVASQNRSTEIKLEPKEGWKGTNAKILEVVLPLGFLKEFADTDCEKITVTVEDNLLVISQKSAAAIAQTAKGTEITLIADYTQTPAKLEMKDGSTVSVLLGVDKDGFYTLLCPTADASEYKKVVMMEETAAQKALVSQEERAKKLQNGVAHTKITLKKAASAKGIKLTWTKSKGYAVDGYQVFRSTKKNSFGAKPYFITNNGRKKTYLNTKGLKTGKKYYYKVRGVRKIAGKTVFTEWSNKVSATVKKQTSK